MISNYIINIVTIINIIILDFDFNFKFLSFWASQSKQGATISDESVLQFTTAWEDNKLWFFTIVCTGPCLTSQGVKMDFAEVLAAGSAAAPHADDLFAGHVAMKSESKASS